MEFGLKKDDVESRQFILRAKTNIDGQITNENRWYDQYENIIKHIGSK